MRITLHIEGENNETQMIAVLSALAGNTNAASPRSEIVKREGTETGRVPAAPQTANVPQQEAPAPAAPAAEAPKPRASRKKATPAAEAPAAPAPTTPAPAPVAATPAAPAPAPAAEAKASVFTEEDVANATRALAQEKGVPVVLNLLKHFGVEKARDLPAEKREEYITLAKSGGLPEQG